MADYTLQATWSTKDALATGQALKAISATELGTEFSAIATAIATKYDNNDIASQAQAEAESSNAVLMTPGRVANWADYNAGMVGDIQALADPNADVLLGWDDSASAAIGFTLHASILHSGTELSVDHDAATNFVADEHIAHSGVTLTAGAGLTGGGTIAASRTFAVGAGSGITVNADDVAITDVTAGAGQPINISSGTFDFDITALDDYTVSSATAGADAFIIDDGGTAKELKWQNFGIPVVDDSTTSPFSAADTTYANKWYSCSNASAISAVIPANASVAYPVGTVFAFYQAGAGQITVSVTSDTLRAPNGAKTSSQYATIFATKVASTTWVITGDAST